MRQGRVVHYKQTFSLFAFKRQRQQQQQHQLHHHRHHHQLLGSNNSSNNNHQMKTTMTMCPYAKIMENRFENIYFIAFKQSSHLDDVTFGLMTSHLILNLPIICAMSNSTFMPNFVKIELNLIRFSNPIFQWYDTRAQVCESYFSSIAYKRLQLNYARPPVKTNDIPLLYDGISMLC